MSSSCIQGEARVIKGSGGTAFHKICWTYSAFGNTYGAQAFLGNSSDAKDFISMVKDNVEGRKPDDILNMGQMPIAFSYYSNNALEVKGAETIHARASMIDTNHVTLTATITASRKMLPPFLIFKGMPNGCIASREFTTFPAVQKHARQGKVWMDEVEMHEWVHVIVHS